MGRHPTLHNDSFASIGCLKDGTQAIGLSLQCIPFANNRGHFGQYLRQVTNLGIQDRPLASNAVEVGSPRVRDATRFPG